jgi:hypothetical protein
MGSRKAVTNVVHSETHLSSPSPSENGVASLAHSRSENGVASLAYSRSENGVASLAYARRLGRAPEIRPPRPDECLSRIGDSRRRNPSIELLTLVLVAGAACVWLGMGIVAPLLRTEPKTQTVVERIIRAESNGNVHAKNPRSSATGAGQILDQTWLENIRRHRQDLILGRSDDELLALRSDLALTREIVARMVERNAEVLKKRGLPVTPGNLYLAHFAGSAGAVALLNGADTLDAATLMAGADSTGKSTREKLVKANPFLATFTVGDMKSWADRRMRG